MTVTLRHFRPLELIEAHNANRAQMSARAFFGPKNQKLREWFCAGHFALAYEESKAPCTVAFEEPDPGNHIDFFLQTPTGVHDFQLVEVQRPGRRRGDEYRPGAGFLHVGEDELIQAGDEGPSWIAGMVNKKRDSYGGSLARLNLLVYANFWARQMTYDSVVQAVATRANDFASIWLLTGDAVACIKASPDLGELSGWYPTPVSAEKVR